MFNPDFLDDCSTNEPPDLKSQIDTLPWSELARHFAFGRLYVVREPWNLLEAAETIKNDDATKLRSAMDSSEFGPPSEAEVRQWHEQKQEFEVLVLHPFVLVSPKI